MVNPATLPLPASFGQLQPDARSELHAASSLRPGLFRVLELLWPALLQALLVLLDFHRRLAANRGSL